MSTEPDEQPIEFIRIREVKALTSLGKTKIYDLMKKGLFPRQVPIGIRAAVWVKSEVLAWNQRKVDDARASESPMGSVRTRIGKNSP